MNISGMLLEKFLNEECFVDTVTGDTIQSVSGKPVRAIVPVHLYGQMANMDEVMRIAEEYKIMVVEDSCQAHGASLISNVTGAVKKAGTVGLAGAFSFYPGKNLGACGEAGAITTCDEALAFKVKLLRDHGQSEKYFHEIEGYNGRLDSLQASILLLKLRFLQEWNEQRRILASRYNEMLTNVHGITTPSVPVWSCPVYHLYVVKVHHRNMLQAYLAQHGIETALHYPVPLHLQKAYRNLGYKKGSFPVSERCADEILSLPLHPWLSDDEQIEIIEKIITFSETDKL
jgi:dTDP-4-amino-4,6-dideoxygalactose transaminase